MAYKKPKGTQDFFPEDFQKMDRVFQILRQQAINYNFKQIESPAFENLSLLTKKEGDEIKSQIFTLDKRGDERFGLRFDLTVPAARMFIEKQKELPKPVKWFYLSRMWRYEKPQSGRLREFYQFSCEIFGSSQPEADAEIISLAIGCLKSLNLEEKDFIVKINNRKLLEGLLVEIAEKSKIPDLIRLIDKKAKMPESEFDEEIKELGVDPEGLKKVLKTRDFSSLNKLAQEGYDELKSILAIIQDESVTIDLSTARGLAYYTGTVFEIFDSRQKFRSIAGGGRYDKMIEMLNGQPTPATGFAIGFATLSLLLKEKGRFPATDLGPDYYIAVVDNTVKNRAIALAKRLRKNSVVELDLMQRNLGNQFKYADKINAKKVIVVGPEELKSNKVKVKDMKTGKEKSLDITRL